MMLRRRLIFILAAFLLSVSSARAGEMSVDLSLILAVDVSLSIGDGEASLQRIGYIQAFRDKRVVDAIQSGSVGKIAISYVEWSSPFHQVIVIPWRVISDEKSAKAFATELEMAPI